MGPGESLSTEANCGMVDTRRSGAWTGAPAPRHGSASLCTSVEERPWWWAGPGTVLVLGLCEQGGFLLSFFLFVCFPSLLFITFCFILDTLYFSFIIYKFSSENNVTTYSTAIITWVHR